jgi:hypothetical protein
VPDKLTICGLSDAPSIMDSTPVRSPIRVGEKRTEIWQVTLGAIPVPQLLDSEKSPDVAMLEIARLALPVSVKFTICTALDVPTT